MVKLSDTDTGGEFPRLSDVSESGEAALHTTQINLAPEAFERFSDVFENAVRRWERIVYPAMFVMVLVMAYGFFLMFNLANDMRIIAGQIAPMGKHMATLSENMGAMTNSIDNMREDMATIARVMPEMNDKLDAMPIISVQMQIMNKRMEVMNAHMEGMNQQMGIMNGRMYRMTGNIGEMNRNVSRPMNFMNSFMPW
jgi:hypothetical protein